MKNVPDPFAPIVNNIQKGQHDKTDDVHLIKDNTSLGNSVHKNFNIIYDSLKDVGNGKLINSNLHETRKELGDDLKAMGTTSKSNSHERVRKEETKMGEKPNTANNGGRA